MEKKYIPLQFSDKFEKVNEEFVKTTISVMSYDQVANGVKFTKQSIMDAIPTLNYCPVIGYFNGEDFEGHAQDMVWSDNGLEVVVKTVPFGVVIKDSQRFEKVQKPNGEYEEYLVCDAYLWARYEDAVDRVCKNKCNQSMEVMTTKTKWQDDYLEIDGFTFSGLCVLGEEVSPAFNLAKIRTSDKFSKDGFKDMYSEMITSLDNFLNFEEGGSSMEENKIIESTVEENVSDEAFVSTVCDKCGKEPCECESNDNKEEMFKKVRKCSSCNEEFETEEETDDFECVECASKCERSEENTIVEEDFKEKYSNLEVEFGRLQKDFSDLEAEVVSLREYKNTKELEMRKSKEDEIFAKFEELIENEEFKLLKKDCDKYSLDDLENKCFAILGRIKFSSKSKTKKQENKIVFNLAETSYSDENPSQYDLTIQKYLKK